MHINSFDNFFDFSKLNFGKLTYEHINKVKAFILDLKERCNKNDIELLITNTPGIPYTIGEGMMVNGYFDENIRTLACAAGKPIERWLTILIHESCHMDQFLENIPEWCQNPGLEQTDRWLSGEEVDAKILDAEMVGSMAVEIDCEKRTVEKIKEWGFDSFINVDEYIQKSNAYILFYLWMREHRKWYEIGSEPYNLPQIVGMMPKTFDIDYTALNDYYRKAFEILKK